MTTANALGWRSRIQHVSRQRLATALQHLLHAATDQQHVIDRFGGNRNNRMSYWVSRPRANSPGRVRQECVLEALDDLQADDRMVWQVTPDLDVKPLPSGPIPKFGQEAGFGLIRAVPELYLKLAMLSPEMESIVALLAAEAIRYGVSLPPELVALARG